MKLRKGIALTTAVAAATLTGLSGTEPRTPNADALPADRTATVRARADADVLPTTVFSGARVDRESDSPGAPVSAHATTPLSDHVAAARPSDAIGAGGVQTKARVTRGVAVLAGVGGADLVDVIARYDVYPDDRELQRLDALGASVTNRFPAIGMLALTVPASSLAEVGAAGSGASLIALDEPVRAASTAAKERSDVPGYLDGLATRAVAANVGVAILDSGVASHYDLNVAERLDCRSSFTDGEFRHEFNATSFSGDDGDTNFSSAWLEAGEADGPGTGDIEVDDDGGLCLSGRCLQVETAVAGRSAERSLDLGHAASATLSFVYSHNAAGGSVALQVSDAASQWQTLATYALSATVNDQAQSFDITPNLSADTRVRFQVTGVDNAAQPGKLGVDNLDRGRLFDPEHRLRDRHGAARRLGQRRQRRLQLQELFEQPG